MKTKVVIILLEIMILSIFFIQSILENDWNTFEKKIYVVLIAWGFVLIAMIVDFISGIRKAKRLGIRTTSTGFRKTVDKFLLYYGALFFVLMIDFLLSYVSNFPAITMFGSVALIIIEAFSVYENQKADDKEKIKDAINTLSKAMEYKDNIPDLLKEISKQLNKKE